MSKYKKATLLLLLVLLFLEGLSRFLLERRLLYRENEPALGSLFWRLEWFRKHSLKDFPTFTLASPLDQHDETFGWSTKASVKAIAFGGKRVTTNEQGFRDFKNYEPLRSLSTSRIMVLGDSFTFGEEVSDFETYPSKLQTLFPSSEIYNLSVHGYGLDQIYLLYHLKGKALRPSHVVLGFTEVDLERNLLSFRDYKKPYFEWENDTLQLRGIPVPSPARTYLTEFFTPKLFVPYEIFFKKLTFKKETREEKAWQLSKQILLQLKKEVGENGGNFSIAYLPVGPELSLEEASPSELKILEFCKNAEVFCFSMGPQVRELTQKGIVFPTVGHWPAELHELASTTFKTKLLEAYPILENAAFPH